ncbi:50S ribosomal protein L25 [Atopococcus tabaci]|uniref:50S ribosomal protein L25 n=1 Tax=Atopococcus tabaci TaxID=269774 RepID=UPI002409933A|nr:50S ribosomal protein L25 [Atopococcus tabaci]
MKIQAQKRTKTGTNASKQARHEGKMPAAIFGRDVDTIPVLVNQKDFEDVLREVGSNGVFDVEVEGGETYQVFVKEKAEAALKPYAYHADLLAFKKGEKVAMTIPVVLSGEEEIDEGVVNQSLTELEIEIAPAEAPAEIVVDVSNLVIGDSLTVANVEVPSGAEVLTEAEYTVVSIVPPSEEEPVSAETEGTTDMPQPEVIGDTEEE